MAYAVVPKWLVEERCCHFPGFEVASTEIRGTSTSVWRPGGRAAGGGDRLAKSVSEVFDDVSPFMSYLQFADVKWPPPLYQSHQAVSLFWAKNLLCTSLSLSHLVKTSSVCHFHRSAFLYLAVNSKAKVILCHFHSLSLSLSLSLPLPLPLSLF